MRYWEEGYNSVSPGLTEKLAESKEQGKSGGQKKPAKLKTKETEQKPEKDWHKRVLYGSRRTILLNIPQEIVKEAGLSKGVEVHVGYDGETETVMARITGRPEKQAEEANETE